MVTAAEKIQDPPEGTETPSKLRSYDTSLLSQADAMAGKARDGKLQLEDVENLIRTVKNPASVSRLEKSTFRHIRDHYPLAEDALERLRKEINQWDGKRFSKGVYLFERVGNKEKLSIVQRGGKKKRASRGKGAAQADKPAARQAKVAPPQLAPAAEPVAPPVVAKPARAVRKATPAPVVAVAEGPGYARKLLYWLLVLCAAVLLMWWIGPDAQPLNNLPVTEKKPVADDAPLPVAPDPRAELSHPVAPGTPYHPRDFVPLKFGRVYSIARGDTLWAISGLEYGDPFLWPYILRANTVTDKNPDLLVPGKVIYLPALEEIARNQGADGSGSIAEAYAYAYMAYNNAGKAKAAGYLRRAIQIDPAILKLFNVRVR